MTTLQVLKDSLQTCIQACPGPAPKDHYVAQHWAMAGAHSFLLNGLISIYEQAATILEKNVDFVGYALQWTGAIHHHHHIEETVYFPMFNPKFDTSFAEAEHGTFTGNLEAFESYLVSCLPSGTKYGLGLVAKPHNQQTYDGAHVCALIDGFGDALCKHLLQEIGYMEPDKLRASGLTEQEIKAISTTSLKHSKALPLTTLVTYAVLLSPKEIQFPPFPPFLRYIVPRVLAIPNRHYWQFAPKQ
ncbi:hypothetical protein EUX98_g826 [Antrodiella citrinella]|uniref:Hemerythrin-like domain-containing protein n=1 Tax=Antrodiella citrinella TaxID=2447956 RepID=A0A4S4N2Y7_9APHY|nr:hypothetical protein EUX98_g826 [Antrodiella citrinella]